MRVLSRILRMGLEGGSPQVGNKGVFEGPTPSTFARDQGWGWARGGRVEMERNGEGG